MASAPESFGIIPLASSEEFFKNALGDFIGAARPVP